MKNVKKNREKVNLMIFLYLGLSKKTLNEFIDRDYAFCKKKKKQKLHEASILLSSYCYMMHDAIRMCVKKV